MSRGIGQGVDVRTARHGEQTQPQSRHPPTTRAAAPSRAPPIISVGCIASILSSSRSHLLSSYHLHHVQPRLLRRRRPAAVLPSSGCVSRGLGGDLKETDVSHSLTGPPPGQGGYYPQQPQQAYGQQPYGQPYGQPYQPQPPPQTVYVYVVALTLLAALTHCRSFRIVVGNSRTRVVETDAWRV